MKKIAVIGSGGFANYVSEIIESTGEYYVVGLIGKKGDLNVDYNDSNTDKLKNDGVRYLANGIGNLSTNNYNIIRLLSNYIKDDFIFPAVIHSSAVVSKSASIGKGAMVMENSVVKSNAVIGDFCVINALSVVSHECVIGDHTHLSLGSKIGGGSVIGSNVLLGINSSVNQKICIGSNSVIGSGAVIIKNIQDNCTVVGNPGKVIKVMSNE